MKSNWVVKDLNEEIVNEFSAVFGLNKYQSSILYAKGISSLPSAYNYLNPKLSALYSPFLMKGMIDAVYRIREAIQKSEGIGIFSDSDLDGLTSMTILNSLFDKMGIETFNRYPVGGEDYGLKNKIIDEFYNNGIQLLITLDSGMSDIEEIAYAKKLGIDVIICDHHEAGKVIPDALIVNPKQKGCRYPFKELAGVGVAFKLCHALLMSYLGNFNRLFLLITKDDDKIILFYIRNGIIEKIKTLDNIFELRRQQESLKKQDNILLFALGKDEDLVRKLFCNNSIHNLNILLEDFSDNIKSNKLINNELLKKIFRKNSDFANIIFSEIEYNISKKIKDYISSIIGLVSIGTIADIMPIYGENRIIVHHGVQSIRRTKHPGLSLLLKKMRSNICTKDIAWNISPLLNSPGRFGKSNLTAQFFLERNPKNLQLILDEIGKINEERRKIISEIYTGIVHSIENGEISIGDGLLFIQSDKIPDGLVGLLANQLTRFVNRPVIVVSLLGNKKIIKGSGRTIGNYNLLSVVEPFADMFEKIGGHPKAFGFSALLENIEAIKEKVERAAGKSCKLGYEHIIDLEISLDAVDLEFISDLSLFEPCGYKNEEPVFLTRDVNIKKFFRFGTNMNHGKYKLADSHIEIIGWNMADVMEKHFKHRRADMIYRVERNEFNGFVSPRVIILDID